jgi:hypothetical protein
MPDFQPSKPFTNSICRWACILALVFATIFAFTASICAVLQNEAWKPFLTTCIVCLMMAIHLSQGRNPVQMIGWLLGGSRKDDDDKGSR